MGAVQGSPVLTDFSATEVSRGQAGAAVTVRLRNTGKTTATVDSGAADLKLTPDELTQVTGAEFSKA